MIEDCGESIIQDQATSAREPSSDIGSECVLIGMFFAVRLPNSQIDRLEMLNAKLGK